LYGLRLEKEMKGASYSWLRKYIACFGLLDCDEDAACNFVSECRTECWTHPDKMVEALYRAAERKAHRRME